MNIRERVHVPRLVLALHSALSGNTKPAQRRDGKTNLTHYFGQQTEVVTSATGW